MEELPRGLAAAALLALVVIPRVTHGAGDAATTEGRDTTVVLTRHAEKAAEPADDPRLSEAGVARAVDLGALLSAADLAAIYATPFRRTRDTALPTAAVHGVEVQVVAVEGDHVARQVEAIRRHPGGTVLVVGHSNTIPDVLAALGVPDPPAIPEDRYGDLFVVHLPAGGGEPSMLHLRY